MENIFGVKGKPIDGVIVKKLNKIADERGTIYHMLRSDDEEFTTFGEIYFSTAYQEAVKGWHYHTKMTLNYAVVKGMIKLVLYDDREDSKTKGNLMEIYLGDENYLLVTVPPKVWNGFKGIKEENIVANCASIPHDPEEIKRMDPHDNNIPYNWERKDG